MRHSEIQELLNGYVKNFKIATGLTLTVSYTYGMKLELEELRKTIDELIDADPLFRCKKQKWVDARIIFTIVARDMKYSLVNIGSALGVDHSSVMYFEKNKRIYHDDFQEKMQVVKTWLMAKEQEKEKKRELERKLSS